MLLGAVVAVLAIAQWQAAAGAPNGVPAQARDAHGHPPSSLVGHGGPVKAVAVSRDGRRALTGSFDYSMGYWDLATESPRLLARFPEHDAAVNVVRFLRDGERAISAGDDGVLRIWDLRGGALLKSFPGHTAKIVDVALSTDGRLAASAGWDRSVRIWPLADADEAPARVLDGHTGPVNAVAFLSNGAEDRLYSAGGDGTIRLWDAVRGTLLRTVYNHGWGINRLLAVNDGLLLFGAVNGSLAVVDAARGEIVKELTAHQGPVLALVASPDRRLVASGGGDGVIRVWDTVSWTLKEQYENPYGPVWGLAFTPDGDRLYHCGIDDFVAVWQVRPRAPFEEVANPLPRRFKATENMTLGERQFVTRCSICHTLGPDDANRAGPTLYRLFGRKAGTLPGYPYSDALRNSGIVWNEETIADLFMRGPEYVTPGTKMPLQRMTSAEERQALIAFLKSATQGGRPDAEAGPQSREQ